MIWAAVKKYHRLVFLILVGDLNKKNLFLKVLEAGKSKIKALADLGYGEGQLSGSEMAILLLCPHMVEGAREALWGLLYKGTNPIH